MLFSRIVLLNFFIFILLPGCSAFDLHLTFNHIDGLEKGDAVIFESTEIGEVGKISYNDRNQFLVTVGIKKEFRSALTEFSRFKIASSPLQSGRKAIIMTLSQKGGTPLQAGTTVEPQSDSPFDSLNPMLDKLQSGFNNFVTEMEKLPESEGFQKFEKKLDELGRNMKNSGEAIKDNIQNNIIPRLKKELDDLREKFGKDNNKEKIEQLEKKLEGLQEI